MKRTTFVNLKYVLILLFMFSLLFGELFCEPQVAAQTNTATPGAGQADDSMSFDFYPVDTGYGSYVERTIQAGASANFSMVLGNTSGSPQDLRIYPINAHTADGGGFAANDFGTPIDGVTLWMDVEESVHTVDPGMGVQTDISISVPQGTPPGQYLTAIVGAQAEEQEVEGTENYSQILRFTIPVFIIVPGDTVTAFNVGSVELESFNGALVVDAEIVNSGDVRVRPTGTIDVRDASGTLLVTFPVSMESVFARDKTFLRVGTMGDFPSGTYQVQIRLNDPESRFDAESVDISLDFLGTGELAEQSIIQISDSVVTPGPDADNVQFANVEATITNDGDPIGNAQLSLIATLDGVEVERFPAVQALSLQSGETPITTRYIPATGWTSGTWTFELLIETVEPGGAAVVVARQPIEGSIIIP